MTGTVRVGLIGYGMAGREFHAPLIAATDGIAVTHVTSSAPERVAAARREIPGVTVVPDVDALLTHAEEIDVVVVASPTGSHVEHALAALALGLPTVVDKPLAVDAEGAATVYLTAEAAGTLLTTFQNRRWDGEQLTLQALLADGVLGDVFRYEGRYERWRPVPKRRWREQLPSAEGGGVLLDLQAHLVDGAVNAFGPATHVYAELSARTTVSDDDALLVLTHDSGVRSYLSAQSLAAAPGPRMRVLGTRGAYVVGGTEGDPTAFTEFADADHASRGWLVRGEERAPVPRAPGTWSDFYAGVAAAIRGEGPVPVDPRDAVHVMAVLDAARRSAASNSVQPVGDPLGDARA